MQSLPDATGEYFGNNASSHDARPSLSKIAVNANPLRILRAAAPELSGIRVGWRRTTIGLCSTRLVLDASSRPLPMVDSSS
ncbi:Predicted ribonuclease [Pseudomonas syringae pv. actinidiae]|uniref:Predicted ribonuclease n=1 Tax=Pseudomonas syringae pv. actinidiae TaxID=103796 RepID=A0A2V0Q7X6_PSESF|nr:Predicted ribonuclease [Pseudomonas syringae pv. actinidiae]